MDGYTLKAMGAEMSNGFETVDIPAKYLCALTDTSAAYAVRILELDSEFKKNCTITATPYVVLVMDGVEVTIYGEMKSASFNSVLNR